MAYEGTSSSVLDPDGWIWVDGAVSKGVSSMRSLQTPTMKSNKCMQQTQIACLFDGGLPSKEGTPPHAAAGLAKDFAKLGDGWGVR